MEKDEWLKLIDEPRFREAIEAVFSEPGDFGPAKGYYRSDIDHFIDMLRAYILGSE